MIDSVEQIIMSNVSRRPTQPAVSDKPASPSVELSKTELDNLRIMCRKSMFFLARAVLGFDQLNAEIHKPICDEIQNYQKNTRIAVLLPRTWFKSTIGSIAYPIWRAINNPNVRILIAQNSMTNAKKKINSIKSIFETNALFRALFSDLLPKGDRPWSSECLTVNRSLAAPEGTFEPAGTGTAVTSRHYDVVIEDDTVAPDFDAMTGEVQQPTQLEIEKAIGWHKLCHPLLMHPLKSQIVIIGTRWAPSDLFGWVFKNSPGYKILSRSALEVPGRIGEPASLDQGGQPVWDRFNLEALHELEASVGPLMFSTLYLNTPTAGINRVFKRSYIQYYERPPNGLLYCTSVDPAAADAATKTDSDYNVVLTTGVNPKTGEVYVVHYDRARCDPGDVINFLFNHYRAYKFMVAKIESVAYQRTLCYWIRRRQQQLRELFPIDEVTNARASKAARIIGLQPWFAANRVYLRKEHSDLERELLSFDPDKRNTGHDDVIDALSMQISFWSSVIDGYKADETKVLLQDPFSGDAVIDELLERGKELTRYPADIGLICDRAEYHKPWHNAEWKAPVALN